MTAKIRHSFITALPADKLLARFPADLTDTLIAEILGVTRGRIQQLRRPAATLRWLDADRYAIRLGVHPAEIWGWLWTYEVRPLEVPKVNADA